MALINLPLWPSGRVCQCCGLWCGLLLCASGGARFWPTMVGCSVWCFVAVCPLCVWWWCWWFLLCALFPFAGALPLLCVQRVPGAVLAPVWWLLSAGPGSCLLVPAGEGLPVLAPVRLPAWQASGAVPVLACLLSCYHDIILKRFFRPLFVQISIFLGPSQNLFEKTFKKGVDTYRAVCYTGLASQAEGPRPTGPLAPGWHPIPHGMQDAPGGPTEKLLPTRAERSRAEQRTEQGSTQ